MFPKMLICPSNMFSSDSIMLLGKVFTLKCCFLLSVSLEPVAQTCITYFVTQKKKQQHVSIQHNSILTLMKSGAPFSALI